MADREGTPGEETGDVRDEAREVRGFWERLGLPGLVDVHTHFMPERVLRKVWDYFDGLGELTGGIEWPIAYRADEDERLALIREFGVRAFTAMLYPHKAGMAEWLNSWAVGFARRTPDCLHTSTLFPEPGVERYVREAVEAGARVFKAHVQVGAYDPADELLDPAWGLLAEAGIPVVIHCGSGPSPGKHTGPAPAAAVLRRHPGCGSSSRTWGCPSTRTSSASPSATTRCGSTRPWRSPTSANASRRSRRVSCPGSRTSGTGCSSARTSRTSRIRTSISCTRWNGSAWGTTGCERSATGTAPVSSASAEADGVYRPTPAGPTG